MIVGDLNEDCSQHQNLKPLRELVDAGDLVDPFADLPDHWTHFYEITGETTRLDYMLVDGALRSAVCSLSINRKGVSLKCASAGERYPTVGHVGTEASDHCPITIALDLDTLSP